MKQVYDQLGATQAGKSRTFLRLFSPYAFLFFLITLMLVSCQTDRKDLRFSAMDNDAYRAEGQQYALTLSTEAIKLEFSQMETSSLNFVGNNKHATPLLYENGEVWYNDLYDGIDLRFYKKGVSLAVYDFVLEPGSSVENIQLAIPKDEAASINEDGELVISTGQGEIHHSKPYTYQNIDEQQKGIESRFVLEDGILSFEVGAHDEDYALVIDPTITFIPNAPQALMMPAPGDACTNIAADEIAGNVWEDWDYDGAMNELTIIGVEGIEVTLTDDCGAAIQTTTTNADGDFTFSGLTGGTTYRVEFNIPSALSWAKPTNAGADNGTMVNFVQPGNCANLGVADPTDYCQENPQMVVPCYDLGSATGTNDAIVGVDYNFSAKNARANFGQVGSTWGVAYDRDSKYAFAASFLKRNSGFAQGPGHIYMLDPTTGLYLGSFDLQGVNGIDAGSVDRSSGPDYQLSAGAASIDLDAFGKIGTISFGDADIFGSTLSVVNLNSKSIINIDISDPSLLPTNGSAAPAGLVTETVLSFPDACTTGEMRPFGLKYYRGNGFLGVVCDASISQDRADLMAYVYQFDPANPGGGLQKVLEFPLDFVREYAGLYSSGGMLGDWQPWVSDWNDLMKYVRSDNAAWNIDHASPVLSDIEFAEDGSMILGMMDRVAHQIGFEDPVPAPSSAGVSPGFANRWSAGDILKACYIGGNFVMEGGAGCSTTDTHAPFSPPYYTNDGPNGAGEFFYEDYFGNHPETALGALAVRAGTEEVVGVIFDPLDFSSQGLRKFSTTDGTNQGSYEIVARNAGPFGKAAGLGDLELLCALPPLEIGNYVWNDTDQDGIQDACEPGIDGVVVELVKGGAVIATTQTANGGQYYFSSQSSTDPNLTWTGTGADTAVLADMTYTIRISNAEGGSQQAVLSGFLLTTLDANSNAVDQIDSDASLNGDHAEIIYTTGDYGCVDHSLDFGFGICELSITNVSVTGCYQSSGQSVATISVEVAWTIAPAGESIIVTGPAGSVPATRTITPGVISVNYGFGLTGNQTIVSPQVVAFEIPADGVSGLTVSAAFSLTSSCNATSASFSAPAACPPLICTGDQTGGTVFNDYNADGIKDIGETNGVSGITVTAYDCDGNQVATTTTNADGRYVFSGLTAADYPIRVEFSGLGTLYGSGTANGADGRTTVQFVTSADCNVDLGVLDSDDHCQTDPTIYVPCFVNGDPLAAGSAAGTDALVSFPYASSGVPGQAGYAAPTHIANASEVGTLWGAAYNRHTSRLFQSATLKRHAGLGPLGIGGIYAIDLTNPGAPVVSSFIDVETDLGIAVDNPGSPVLSNAARGLLADKTQPSNDPDVISQIGRVGIGDIDISANGNTLWFVNIYDKTLYEVDITAYNADGVTKPTAASTTAHLIPNPGCVGGEARPYALKVYNGEVYVGVVCDAGFSQNKSDLRAYIYKWNGAWSTVFDFPLTYPKGFPDADPFIRDRTGWYPWTDDWATYTSATRTLPDRLGWVYPMPMLTDIEFDIDGSMVIAFGDRAGFIGGNRAYPPIGNSPLYSNTAGGDVLRAQFSNGIYILENNAKAGSNIGFGPNNNQGLGFGEFYDDNLIWSYDGGVQELLHAECVIGALALRPGSGEMVVTALDPLSFDVPASFSSNPFDINGIIRSNNSTGAKNAGYAVYQGEGFNGLFGKAAGLGDVELGCAPPTYLQIGNYVWHDADKDGVQDACESALAGVEVSLYKIVTGNPTFVAVTTTGANGEYYFTGLGAPGETWVSTSGFDSLQANMDYKIVFGYNGQTSAGQFALDVLTISGIDYILTTANTGEGANADLNDSDATLMSIAGGSYPSISVTTGGQGSVNHTHDAGFWFCPEIVNPSATQSLCEGDAGGDITVETNTNAANSIRFVRFTTDQTATNGSETPVELAAIYSGGTVVTTVTPTGGSSPYTATLTAATAGWNALAPGTYYIYAILNPDEGASCRPVQEIRVTIAAITSAMITATCNDNGTPSDPSDDTFTYTINVTGANTGATYSISGDDTQAGLSYGVVNGPFGPFPIASGDLTITITDVDDAACQLLNQTVSAPATCSDVCLLNAPTIVATCNDNGTPSDPSDDTFTYTINVTGANTGATYSISGDDTQAGLSYGVVNGPFGPFPIASGDLSITITDVDDAGCQLVNETVSAPATCSDVCLLNAPTIVATCNDNGTPSDPSDDTFTYTINVTGANTGATYSISGDDTQAGLSYGVVNGPFGPFPIASGGLTITITDVDDVGCQLVDETVSAPATCSDVELVAVGNYVYMDVNDNGTFEVGTDMPLAGVVVELYAAGDVAGTDTPVATTSTSGTGYYYFDELTAASYFVHIPAVNFATGQPLFNKESYPGADGTDNTDNNDNGIDTPVGGGISSNTFTLTPNAAPTGEDQTDYPGTLDDDNVNGTIDFTFQTEKVAVGNYVYMDVNDNGTFEVGTDMPLAGVVVELYAAGDIAGTDTPVATTSTSGTGYYYFDELTAASYFVHIPAVNFATGQPLFNKESYPGADGTDNTDNNDNGIDTPVGGGISSNTFTLTPNAAPTGEDQTDYPGTLDDDNVNGTIDFTLQTEKVAVGNYVYMDVNDNGTFEVGTDMPLSGVVVELYAAGDIAGTDTPVATTSTSTTGYYYFDELTAASYFVHIPAVNFATGQPLFNKESYPGADGTDNTDNNDNGIDTPVGGGISSNTFTLTPNAAPTGEDQTDYPGTLDDDNVNGTIDFTFQTEKVAVGNYVYMDVNDNGTFEVGTDMPLAGVVVELYAAGDVAGTDTPVATTSTSGTGYYYFDELTAASYFVHIPAVNFATGQPLFNKESYPGADGTDNTDNNDNGIDTPVGGGISSNTFTLTPNAAPTGEDQTDYPGTLDDDNVNGTIDFTFQTEKVAVGNYVYMDVNDNGSFEVGTDMPLAGVVVELYAAGDVAGTDTPVATTSTSGTGYYYFDELTAASYFVHIPAVNFATGQPLFNKESYPGADGTDNTDNNDNGIDTPVGGGISSNTFTLTPNAAPTGEDQTDYPGTLDDDNVNGTIDFTFQTEKVAVGNYVYMDVNDNGTFEVGTDMPLAGVVVELYAAGDIAGTDTPVATTSTSGTGYYYFDELTAASYFVHIPAVNFATGQPLFNKESYPGADGTDNTDNNDNGIDTPVGGGISSNTFTLTPNAAPTGEDQTDYPGTLDDDNVNGTIDFTFQTEKVAVGNYVYMDVNDNGTFEVGTDMPLAGVVVELYAAGDIAGTDTPVATTSTSGTGYYYFDELTAASYFVHIPAVNFATGQPLFNKESYPGADGTDNTDNNDNGIDTPVGGGISSNTFTLTPNAAPTGEDQTDYPGTLDDDNVNGTIDFTFQTEKVAVGNYVYMDVNDNGSFEVGTDMPLAGVVVELYAAGDIAGTDTPVATTSTSGTGYYYFDELTAASYFVHIPAVNFATGQPLFNKESYPGADGTDNTDNNDNGIDTPVGGGISSNTFTLTPNAAPTGEDQTDYPGTLDDDNVNGTIDFTFQFVYCLPPTNLTATMITPTNGQINWTSNNDPFTGIDLTNHCWRILVGGQGFDPAGAQAVVDVIVCAGPSNGPTPGLMINGANVSYTIEGLAPGTCYDYYIVETCDGLAPPHNVTDFTGPDQFCTPDLPFIVEVQNLQNPSCPGGDDGSFDIVLTDGNSCGPNIYNITQVSGPNTLTPGGYTSQTAGTFSFAGAVEGTYVFEIDETGATCNPFNDPETITVVVPMGVDVLDPIFYLTDIFGNVLADTDPLTAIGATLDLGDLIMPEGTCARQDQFLVYGTDNCELPFGFINTPGAVTVTAMTTPATIIPGTQVVSPAVLDGSGINYLIDIYWSVGQTLVTINGKDASDNTVQLFINANVIASESDLSITAAPITAVIPACAESVPVLFEVMITGGCDDVYGQPVLTLFGAHLSNLQLLSNNGNSFEYTVDITAGADPAIDFITVEYTSAMGHLVSATIGVTSTAVLEDQDPVIYANAENQVISACEETVDLIYSFTVCDDCQAIDLDQLIFNDGGSGLGNTIFFSDDAGANCVYVEYRGDIAPGTYFPVITYGPTSVNPSLVVTQNPDQLPVIEMPGNLNFTIPVCQESVEQVIALTISDDCDEFFATDGINIDGLSLTLGGATLTPSYYVINEHSVYVEYVVTLDATMSGQLLVASIGGATVDALIVISAQPDVWAPLIIYPSQDINVELDACDDAIATVTFEVTATDNCGDETIQLTVVSNPPNAGGLVLDSPGGDTYIGMFASNESYQILITATDAAGNVRQEDFFINVSQDAAATPNLSCRDNINITLDADCQAVLDPSLMLSGEFGCLTADDFIITVIDSDPSNGALIDGCGEFPVQVELVAGVNGGDFTNCWGYVTAEDKTKPVLECPDDTNQALLSFEVQTLNGNVALTDPSIQALQYPCFYEVLSYQNPGANGVTDEFHYDLFNFTVTQSDNYTFFFESADFTGANGGAMALMFQGGFDPAEPCANVIFQNDQQVATGALVLFPSTQAGGFYSSFNPLVRITLPLQAGVTYSLLTTGTFATTLGDYSWSIYSDGNGVVQGPGISTPQTATALAELVCDDINELSLNSLAANVPHCYTVDGQGNVVYPTNFQERQRLQQLLDLLAKTGYPVNGDAFNGIVTDNCGDITVCVSDVLTIDPNCAPNTIARTFTAVDAKGNEAPACTQLISARKLTLADVMPPPLTAFVECDEGDFSVNNPSPAITGYPFVQTAHGFENLGVAGAQEYCNLAAQYSDQARIEVCPSAYKFIRTWNVLNWCNPIESQTFVQIIKVGDFSAPEVSCPLVDYDWDGNYDILTYSTGPFDCTAAFVVPAPTVTDNCSAYEVTTEVVTTVLDTIYDQWGIFIEQIVEVDQVIATILPNASQYVSGIPVGCHRFRYTVTDECGNTAIQECAFQVEDQVEPIAVCDDDLNISIGGEGYARVYASDIDEGSSDNCGPIRVEVRRLYTEDASCASVTPFYSPWGDYVDFNCCDITDLVRIELRVWDDRNGDGIAGNTIPVTYCDGTTKLVTDNSNTCWLDVLIEDKIRPVCTPPHAEVRNCTDLPYNFSATDTILLQELFGNATATDNCPNVAYTQELPPINNLDDCGFGTIIRRFRALDAQGNVSVNSCQQLITINEVHEYEIKFPKDASANCGEPMIDTIDYEEIGCDLLAIGVSDDTLSASGDECYKIFRTYTVTNWCEYDGISPAVTVSRDEDCDGNPGDEAVWVLVRPNGVTYFDRDNDETNNNPFAFTKGTSCDGITNPTGHWINSTIDVNATRDPITGVVQQGIEPIPNIRDIASRGFWKYEQHIRVYDNVDPIITVDPYDAFCSYDGENCTGEVEITFVVDENCTPDDLDIIIYLDVDADGSIDFNSNNNPSVVSLSGSYPNYTITGTYPLGNHEYGIRVDDGCGNYASADVPFVVVDCKAPSPVCINGLAIELMPQPAGTDADGDGDEDCAAMAIWANDFIASPVYDCTGQGDQHPSNPNVTEILKYSIHRADSVIAGVEFPDPSVTGLVATCDDPQTLIVRIYAWDNANNPYSVQPDGTVGGPNYDFCETYILVQDNQNACNGANCTGVGSRIAGVIMTEQDEAVEGVEVGLSGQTVQDMVTLADGAYLFEQVPDNYDYTVAPVLDLDHSNGVSTFDLVLISKHILGTQLLGSPYKMIAADANNSKTITTLDIIQIRKLILHIYTEFPNNTSWRFVEASYIFPDPTNPWAGAIPEVINFNNLNGDQLDQDFVGIKIGDVNGSAQANFTSLEDRTTHGLFAFDLQDQHLKAGNDYQLDFRASDIAKIQGYQLTLSFDGNQLEYLGMNEAIVGAEHIGLRYVDEGMITLSWNMPNGQLPQLSADQVLFGLSFRARANVSWSEVLGVSSHYTMAEAYDIEGELLEVGLNFQDGPMIVQAFELYQNRPNPFRESTVIGFYLPENTEARLRVQDASGRTIKIVRADYKKGYNEVILKASELSKGVLYYTLQTDDHSASRKMIISD